MSMIEVLVTVIPIRYELLHVTNRLSIFLLDLEIPCTIEMTESGIQNCLETFLTLIIHLVDSILTSLEILKILKLIGGMKPMQN